MCNIRGCFRTCLFAAAGLFILAGEVCAQAKGEKKIMGIPQAYIRPELGSMEDNSLGILTGSRWEVISDRAGNSTYTDNSGKNLKFRVGFLEPFYVTNEMGEYLHIYSDPQPGPTGLLSSKAIDRGWIRKSCVIPWKNCIISGSTKRHIQVLTHGSPDLFASDSGEGQAETGIDVYSDPGLKEKSHVKTRIRTVYYVYKKAGNAILLGEKKRIPLTATPAQVIIGWVPEEYCYVLDTRVWITSNKTEEALKEMDEKQVIPSLFIQEGQAQSFSRTMETEKRYIVWQEGPVKKNAAWTCFPLISKTDRVYKVSVIENNFEPGYAAARAVGMDHPVFIEVTLISHEELSNVVSNIDKLTATTGDDLDREIMRKCLVNLYKTEYSGLNDDYIKNLSLREIMDGLFWISGSTENHLDIPLRKITDPAEIGDGRLGDLIGKMKSSVVEMKKIINETTGTTGARFISDGMPYYWVDLALFF